MRFLVPLLVGCAGAYLGGCVVSIGRASLSPEQPRRVKKLQKVTSLDKLVFGSLEHERRVAALSSELLAGSANADTYLELGRILVGEGYLVEAIDLLESGLKSHPAEVNLYLLLSSAYERQEKAYFEDVPPRTLWLLEEAVSRFPENGDAHLNLGYAYSSLRKTPEAIGEFRRALEFADEPLTSLSAHMGLFAAYKKLGDDTRADEHYQHAREIYPEIEEIIIHSEIREQLPIPRGVGSKKRSATHPGLGKRLREALEQVKELSGEEN